MWKITCWYSMWIWARITSVWGLLYARSTSHSLKTLLDHESWGYWCPKSKSQIFLILLRTEAAPPCEDWHVLVTLNLAPRAGRWCSQELHCSPPLSLSKRCPALPTTRWQASNLLSSNVTRPSSPPTYQRRSVHHPPFLRLFGKLSIWI